MDGLDDAHGGDVSGERLRFVQATEEEPAAISQLSIALVLAAGRIRLCRSSC